MYPIAPRRAGQNPRVRIVFPSGALVGHESVFWAGVRALERSGCTVSWTSGREQDVWRGYLAGPDEVRLEELCEALTDPEVDIVWCARGGSGLNRYAHQVVERVRGYEPKCFVGFSDITALLNPLAQELGWITFHGPVVNSLSRSDIDAEASDAIALLQGSTTSISIPKADVDSLSGQIYGGNLTVLASMLGTKTAPKAVQNSIWFLEDVGEAPYRLDRCFTQLVEAGVFDGTHCIWLGDLGLADASMHNDIVAALREDAPCQVVEGAPAGHVGVLKTLPIGGLVRIDFREGTLEATHDWVLADDSK